MVYHINEYISWINRCHATHTKIHNDYTPLKLNQWIITCRVNITWTI